MQTLEATSDWRAQDGLTATSLRALLDGEIPAICIAGFASKEECRALCDAIRSGAVAGRAAQTSTMNLIGANFSNHAGTKAEYFEHVKSSYADVGRLYERAGFSPLERMIEKLQAIWPGHVGVAQEPGHGRYFAGGFKTRSTSGHMHYDFAPHTAPDYAIGGIVDQLGWNLYLDMPTGTGETITYRRPVPRDVKLGSGAARALDIDRNYVAGAESYTFRPEIGDVVIINTRNPHDIIVGSVVPGEWRAQTSSFIGRLPNDDLILWS
jgi:hypothetical protein